MSWSGPVAGAPPFHQPPYANSQPDYGQQAPYQYGPQPQQPAYGQYPPGHKWSALGLPQRAPDTRLPKKKGNPIITRYPPPPGYCGPAQPQGPFGASQYPSQYQSPQSGYPQAPPAPPLYPQQGYNPPPVNHGYTPQGFVQPQHPNYSHHSFPQAQNSQWSQQGYQSNQGYSQPPPHPGTQGYAPSQSNCQSYPSQLAPGDPNQQSYGQNAIWPLQNGQHQYPLHPQSLPDPNATPTPATIHLATSQATVLPNQPMSAVSEDSSSEKPQLFLAWDDWDFDFDGAIWPKSNEPVDPNLSLGVIIWHPAKQITRALPSTFAEAEDQSSEPPQEKLDNGESVSMYFMAENSHEAFLDVRQTDEWESIRDDPVFVVFTEEQMQHNLVSLEDCIAQRDRPDETHKLPEQDDDQEMRDATWDIMENLEEALSGSNKVGSFQKLKQETPSSPSISQEDILAKLGVTGTPKPLSSQRPSSTPLPTLGDRPPNFLPEKPLAAPPPLPHHASLAPQRAQSYGGFATLSHGPPFQRPNASMSSSALSRPPPPPPPPPPEQQRYDPWNAPQRVEHNTDGSRRSPALSESSNRTMAGSDFDPESPNNEQEPSTIPALERSDSSFSRKRNYEDADHGSEKLRQQDEHAKRKRRLQVDAAYSRR